MQRDRTQAESWFIVWRPYTSPEVTGPLLGKDDAIAKAERLAGGGYRSKVRMNDGEFWVGGYVVCSRYQLTKNGWDAGVELRQPSQRRLVEGRWGR